MLNSRPLILILLLLSVSSWLNPSTPYAEERPAFIPNGISVRIGIEPGGLLMPGHQGLGRPKMTLFPADDGTFLNPRFPLTLSFPETTFFDHFFRGFHLGLESSSLFFNELDTQQVEEVRFNSSGEETERELTSTKESFFTDEEIDTHCPVHVTHVQSFSNGSQVQTQKVRCAVLAHVRTDFLYFGYVVGVLGIRSESGGNELRWMRYGIGPVLTYLRHNIDIKLCQQQARQVRDSTFRHTTFKKNGTCEVGGTKITRSNGDRFLPLIYQNFTWLVVKNPSWIFHYLEIEALSIYEGENPFRHPEEIFTLATLGIVGQRAFTIRSTPISFKKRPDLHLLISKITINFLRFTWLF